MKQKNDVYPIPKPSSKHSYIYTSRFIYKYNNIQHNTTTQKWRSVSEYTWNILIHIYIYIYSTHNWIVQLEQMSPDILSLFLFPACFTTTGEQRADFVNWIMQSAGVRIPRTYLHAVIISPPPPSLKPIPSKSKNDFHDIASD